MRQPLPPIPTRMALFILCGPRYAIVLGLSAMLAVIAIAGHEDISQRIQEKIAAISRAAERIQREGGDVKAVAGALLGVQRFLQAGRLEDAERLANVLLLRLGEDPSRFKTRRPALPIPLLTGAGVISVYNTMGGLLIRRVPPGVLAASLTGCDIAMILASLWLTSQGMGPLEQLLLLAGLFSLAVLFGRRVGTLALLVYAATEGISLAIHPASILANMHLILFPTIFVILLFYIGYVTEEQRKAEAARLENAVLEERQSLARELHDSLGATVATISTGLEVLRKRVSKDPESAGEMLSSLSGTLRRFYRDLKDMTHLYRTEMDRESLAGRIQTYVHDLIFSEQLQVSVGQSGGERRLSPPLELALFRIAQEGMQNILAHASARTASVMVRYGDDAVELSIQDDGTGFEVEQRQAEGTGLGFRHIQERAERLGGTSRVESAPGQGTTVSVRIPYR